MENTSTLAEYRQMIASGIDPYAQAQESQVDAAPMGESYEATEQTEAEIHESTETQETGENADLSDSSYSIDDEPIEVPKEQQTAFQKALEREKRKARESAEKKYKEQLEAELSSKLNPYQKFFDQLGVTPEQAMASIEQNRIRQEAENLAYQNGWDDQQTQWYIQQQQQAKELQDLRVSVQINELADTPDYPGIKSMKGQISDFIRQNPNMSITQAYWAVGGQSLAQQLKREAEQREIAKRSQTRRTVATDAPITSTGPAPLTPEAVTFMKTMNMTESQVRQLMAEDFPKDLQSFRKMKGRK